MIFAVDETIPWWWAAILTVGGTVGGWLATQFWTWLKDKRVYEKELKREALGEAYNLIDRLRKDLDAVEARAIAATQKFESKLEAVEIEHQRCLIKYERAITQIEYMKDALTRNNIPFRVLTNMEGSGDHRPLPSGDDK